MDQDFKLLLSEYSRLASTSASFTDSPLLIPLLLRTGSFTPSRLDHWPLPAISSLLDTDVSYRLKFASAFSELVSASSADSAFSLNEKKAVSFLLATKEYPHIHYFLHDEIISKQRILLACLEYSCLTPPLPEQVRHVLLPCQQIDSLAPKFKSKYPLLSTIIACPSIEPAKLALDRLCHSQAPDNELELIAALQCAARSLNSQILYSEIIAPIWGTKNEKLAIVVLQCLALCPALVNFCLESIRQLENTEIN